MPVAPYIPPYQPAPAQAGQGEENTASFITGLLGGIVEHKKAKAEADFKTQQMLNQGKLDKIKSINDVVTAMVLKGDKQTAEAGARLLAKLNADTPELAELAGNFTAPAETERQLKGDIAKQSDLTKREQLRETIRRNDQVDKYHMGLLDIYKQKSSDSVWKSEFDKWMSALEETDKRLKETPDDEALLSVREAQQAQVNRLTGLTEDVVPDLGFWSSVKTAFGGKQPTKKVARVAVPAEDTGGGRKTSQSTSGTSRASKIARLNALVKEGRVTQAEADIAIANEK